MTPHHNSSRRDGPPRFSLRKVFLFTTLLAVGLGLCRVGYQMPYWGVWVLHASFCCGLVMILIAIGVFVGALRSPAAGALTFVALLHVAVFLLGTFPGRMVLYKLLY